MTGFAPDEIRTDESTRSARLKWVVMVDADLPPGRAANAAICVAAAPSAAVTGLLGPDTVDGAGTVHPGLPWAGCSVLAASVDQLAEIRSAAMMCDDVYVADMPLEAQRSRVYDEYREQLAVLGPAEIGYHAVSLVGPRRRIDKLVRKLSLLP